MDEKVGTIGRRWDRSQRADDISLDAVGDVKAYRYKDILNLAYHSGFIGFERGSIVSMAGPDGEPYWIAEVYARFGDGSVHYGVGDSSLSNTNRMVSKHGPRMANTRAKARALADALNLDAVTAEELGDNPQNLDKPAFRKSSAPRKSSAASNQLETPPFNNEFGDGWVCDECLEEGVDTPITDTAKFSAQDLAARSYAQTGKVLCYKHRFPNKG